MYIDFLKNGLLASTLLLSSSLLVAAPAQSDAVAVFLSANESKVNISTLEFFRAVSDEIAQAKTWSVVDGTEIRKSATINSTQFIGRIPLLPRGVLLKAHPEVASYAVSKHEQKKLSARQKVIPSVQETLDTLAVQGAVIVDCLQVAGEGGSDRIRGCGLYYYDRASGKVVASSRKSFRVGVASANMWAGTMVDGLKSGLDSHKARQDRDRLSSIVEKNDPKEAPARPYMSAGLVGESIRLKGGDTTNLAGGVAGLGAAFSGRSLGLEYSQAALRGDRIAKGDRYTSRSATLVLGVSAEAMDIVTWGLDITAGMSERRYWVEDEEVLRSTQPSIGIRPGVFWRIKRSWLMGATFSYRSAYGGEEKVLSTISQTSISGFHSGSWLTGISTRVEF